MNAVLDTRIAGGPAGCRRSASEIRRLGHALGEATGVCERQRSLTTSEFGGLAGGAFRIRVAALASMTRGGWERCEALAAGLDHLVDELTGCEEEMARIRAEASGLLDVRGGSIHRPARTAGSGSETAWIAAVRAVAAVRRREGAAQAQWEAVLTRPWPEQTGANGTVGDAAQDAGAALSHWTASGPSHHPPHPPPHPSPHDPPHDSPHHPPQHLGQPGPGHTAPSTSGHAAADVSPAHYGFEEEHVGPGCAAVLCDPAEQLLGPAPVYYRADAPAPLTTGGS